MISLGIRTSIYHIIRLARKTEYYGCQPPCHLLCLRKISAKLFRPDWKQNSIGEQCQDMSSLKGVIHCLMPARKTGNHPMTLHSINSCHMFRLRPEISGSSFKFHWKGISSRKSFHRLTTVISANGMLWRAQTKFSPLIILSTATLDLSSGFSM